MMGVHIIHDDRIPFAPCGNERIFEAVRKFAAGHSAAATTSNMLPFCRVKGLLFVNTARRDCGISHCFVADRPSLFFGDPADCDIRPDYDRMACKSSSVRSGFPPRRFFHLSARTVHRACTHLEKLCRCLGIAGLFICLCQ